MSTRQRHYPSRLQKVVVTCKTCEVTESFYSSLSVQPFKFNHAGHEVVIETEQGGPSKSPDVKPTPTEERGESRLPKVLVDLVVLPDFPHPMFRISGLQSDLETAFVQTMHSGEGDNVLEFVTRGRHFDDGVSGVRYVWEPDAVEYTADARARIDSPTQEVEGVRPPQPTAEPQGGVQAADPLTVARTTETVLEAPKAGEASQANVELLPTPLSVPPSPHEEVESPATTLLPQSAPKQASEQMPMDASTPRPQLPVRSEKLASEVAPTSPPEEVEDDYLLVSRSWYVQGGTQNRKEAARISKILKAFRWNVEPLYTVGVILDDILSIETSKTQISRALIKQIENAGYKLTAVTVDQCKPVAWFKKAVPEEPRPQLSESGMLAGSVEREMGREEVWEEGMAHISHVPEETSALGSGSSIPRDLEVELEPDVA